LAAQELAAMMLAHFQASGGGFYDTSDDHETLITRPRDLQDNATPSGNAMAVTALLKLAGLTHGLRYVDIARQALARGAHRVDVAVTHALLVDDATDVLSAAGVNAFLSTDTVPHSSNRIDTTALVSSALRRLRG
jgi:uncharacterized protein YyaL (SSP411 family)